MGQAHSRQWQVLPVEQDDSRGLSSKINEHIDIKPTAEVEKVPLSNYNIEGYIGSGSYGTILQVMDVRSGRQLALKVLFHYGKNDTERAKCFERQELERSICYALAHPFIINTEALVDYLKFMCFVTEWAPYGTMKSVVENYDFYEMPESTLCFVVVQLVLALVYLHRSHIIHRDIKPDNILIGSDGYIRLCDFGLAKKLGLMRRTYTLCGTVYYMAPEMSGTSGYGKPVDWFAVGSTMCNLINKTPWETFHALLNRKERVSLLKRRIVYDENPTVQKISIRAREFLRGLLRKEPGNRLGVDTSKILNHAWVLRYDLNALYAKRYVSPFLGLERVQPDTMWRYRREVPPGIRRVR